MSTDHRPDYTIRASSPAPIAYPSRPVPDAFSEQPFLPDYESRRSAYLEHILQNPAPENTKAAWYELARLAAGGPPHEGVLYAALDYIDARKDCADFILHGIIRLLENREQRVRTGHPVPTHLLSHGLLSRTRQSVLNFKYFPDEPGIDSMCTWTENHYILFTSAAYLAGQMYPGEIFTNTGETGRQKAEKNRPRIMRWLDLRFRTGFSEWLSHVYYDVDLVALLSLYDFAKDEEIRHRAATIIDLILLDMSLNSFKGVFGSTHGRSYENTKKWASNEGTTDTSKLMFGMGIFSGHDNMSAIALALSGYRMPEVLEKIASDSHLEEDCHLENRQRMGIKLNEMENWGLHPDNFEDGMLYLTLEAYLHPRTITNTLKMFDTCNWWENAFLSSFNRYRGLLRILSAVRGLPLLARVLERDVCRNTREEVNIYTFKTPDYMLSTAQDYRKGYGGDQQHIWQATLGPDVVCFTTHPARIEGVTPNYWAGSGLLPRAAQYKNLTIAIYNIKKIPALYVPIRHFFTHAWLPKDKFDKVIERPALSTTKGGWIFARKGEGYLALCSKNPYFWNSDSKVSQLLNTESGDFALRQSAEDTNREIIAPGEQNIWLCQLGRKTDNGSFEQFIQTICAAKLTFSGLNVEFRSPGNGLVRFGWEGALHVDGVEIPLHHYPRYDNPYLQVEFDPDEITVSAGKNELYLNWKTGERSSL